MLPKRDDEAANLLGLSLLIAAGMSALMVPIIYFGGDPLLQLLNAPELAPYLWLSPLAVFLGGLFLALNYWNSRTKRFGRLSLARINASISTTGAQIGAGVGGYPTGGSLIGANILGSAVSNLVLGGQIWRDDRRVFRNSIHIEDMKSGIWRYRRFPIFDSWSSLLNSMSLQLPVFLLSAFFSPIIVGYYAICNRLLFLPSSLIGTSISQVFFQRSSVAKYEGNLSSLVESAFIRLFLIGFYPFLLLSIIGRELVVVVLGLPWEEAGVFVQILAPWTLFVFIASPMSVLMNTLERQRIALIFNVFFFTTRFLSLFIGGILSDVRLALSLFAFSGIFLIFIKLLYTFNIAGVSLQNILKKTIPYIIYSIFAVFTTLILKNIFLNYYIIITSGLITIALYYIIVCLNDDVIKILFNNFLKNAIYHISKYIHR